MRIIAYDPDNFPVASETQHVWRYEKTVYVTPIIPDTETTDTSTRK